MAIPPPPGVFAIINSVPDPVTGIGLAVQFIPNPPIGAPLSVAPYDAGNPVQLWQFNPAVPPPDATTIVPLLNAGAQAIALGALVAAAVGGAPTPGHSMRLNPSLALQFNPEGRVWNLVEPAPNAPVGLNLPEAGNQLQRWILLPVPFVGP
ncbi:hypothetical protein BS47DRAFT_1338890 [Hydnum rufescens UP504]|uniref:Uncharacterized protein n=1 Tax=Hydnum rufescens UP504 TaxID=1448309 RepID=A0A9P6E0L9_9AGAM|nr:hypothetical protein BS47DRAFT_1338890 [Hydnum rufescens UP504]